MPIQLAAQTNYTWKYKNALGLATGGIYSNKDVEKLQEFIMFPLERAAILNTIARGATDHSIVKDRIKLNKLVDESEILASLSHSWGKIYNFFNTVGTFGVTIFGAYLVLRIIKFTFDLIIHGYALHSTYGCSFWIMGAVWGTLASYLVQRHATNSNVEKEMEIFETKNHSEKPQIKNLKNYITNKTKRNNRHSLLLNIELRDIESE